MNGTHGMKSPPSTASNEGCDAQTTPRPRRRNLGRKSPGLAALLSLMPGLGQVYVGFVRRGFVYMAVVAIWITALSADLGGLEPLFGFSLTFFWIYNMIDASRVAKLYNRASDEGEEIDLRELDVLPEAGGSLVGGLALIAGGLLLLLHLKFDVSLRWLEEWWPLAPIALGVHLVWKSIKARHGLEQ